jgi:transposase
MRRKRYAARSEVGHDHLVQMIVPETPKNLIGDNAYDSDRLDTELRRYRIELIAPHRSNRRNKTRDLRRMRRYRRRWKIERLFAWLQNFRRLVVRYERYAENFLGNAPPRLLPNSTEAFVRRLVVFLPLVVWEGREAMRGKTCDCS